MRLVDEFAQPFITLTEGLPACVLRSDSPILAIALFCAAVSEILRWLAAAACSARAAGVDRRNAERWRGRAVSAVKHTSRSRDRGLDRSHRHVWLLLD